MYADVGVRKDQVGKPLKFRAKMVVSIVTPPLIGAAAFENRHVGVIQTASLVRSFATNASSKADIQATIDDSASGCA